jgi:hypothetical protein
MAIIRSELLVTNCHKSIGHKNLAEAEEIQGATAKY